jgi:hypothetical protein
MNKRPTSIAKEAEPLPVAHGIGLLEPSLAKLNHPDPGIDRTWVEVKGTLGVALA